MTVKKLPFWRCPPAVTSVADLRRPGATLMVLLGVLYFAQGLPFGLLSKSLPAILRDAGIANIYIGLLALPALPWAFKFVWSPWVDRWGRGRANHRKRWILVSQLAAIATLLVIGALPPNWLFGAGLWWLFGLLFVLNLCFATHDVASDGLAVRLLPPALRGLGNSLQTGGYKAGMIVGGAALLVGVEAVGWRATLWLLALVLLLFLVPVWRFPEPLEPRQQREPVSLRWWWRNLCEFWLAPGMGLWLLLLLGYKLGDSLGSRMIKPLLVDAGWRLSEIAAVDLVASIVGLAGAALAGVLLLRLPRIVALVGFGVLQSLGLLMWGLLDPSQTKLVWCAAIVEQLADGLSTVALFTMMMDRCRRDHEGVDYTMQACLLLLSSGLFTLASGAVQELLGYALHFQVSAVLALAAIMPAIFWKRAIHDRQLS